MDTSGKRAYLHSLARAKSALFCIRDAASAEILSIEIGTQNSRQKDQPQSEALMIAGRGDHLTSLSALRTLAREGWTKTDATTLWTECARSTIRFRVGDTTERPTTAVLNLRAFLNAENAQSITLAAGEQRLATVKFGPGSEVQSVRVAIPAQAFSSNDILELVINVQAPSSPKELGLGDDARMLGVALTGLRLL